MTIAAYQNVLTALLKALQATAPDYPTRRDIADFKVAGAVLEWMASDIPLLNEAIKILDKESK